MPRRFIYLWLGMAIHVTGASFLWPLNTIYMHEVLGKSLTFAGLVLFANSAFGMIGNIVGGSLFDKVGGYRTVLVGIFFVFTASFLLIFFHRLLPYIVLLILLGFGSGLIFPAMYAMAGTVWPEGGRKSFNRIYVAQNVGVAIGAALGGFAAQYSFTVVFAANSLLTLSFFLLALFAYRGLTGQRYTGDIAAQNVTEVTEPLADKKKLAALSLLCAAFFLCWVAYVQWQSTISAYTQSIGIGLDRYSLLWTVNGALIVLGQPLLAPVIRRVRGQESQMMLGIALFFASFSLLIPAEKYFGFLVAMIILTIGEMFVWPAVPSLAHRLAPEGKAGVYQGFVNGAATAGRMIGPFAGGFIADVYGMTVLLIALLGLLMAAALTAMIYAKNARFLQVSVPHAKAGSKA